MPGEAAYFLWINPPVRGHGDLSKLDETQLLLIRGGGFVYFDNNGTLLGANAASLEKDRDFSVPRLSFGPCRSMTAREARAIAHWRWAPANSLYLKQQGACKFAWIGPQEVLASTRFGAHGGFAFQLYDSSIASSENAGERRKSKELRYVYFPVLGDQY